MKRMNPKVKSVRPQSGHELALEFENGERRLFDIRPYLDMGVFKQLRDPSRFQSARVVAGSVEWAGEIDLSYDTLYLDSKPAAAKKKVAARRRMADLVKYSGKSTSMMPHEEMKERERQRMHKLDAIGR